jgi:filamentous hemagglutinin
MSKDPDMPPPPAVGEVLARATEAFGLRYKLETYSLDPTHKVGGPKARGFEQILGITIEAIDYLEAQILARVLDTPVSEVRDNPPYGIKCTVDIQVPGIGAKADRVANVRTVWVFDQPGAPPRLVTAIPKS